MSTVVTEPGSGVEAPRAESLLRTWRELDVPDGWRAEIIDGDIRLMPPPSDAHNFIANRIHKLLVRGLPDDWGVYQTLGIWIAMLSDLYVPDLVVMPDSVVEDTSIRPKPADEAMLAVEIVSKKNAAKDRTTKLSGYAHGPVPLYLLVDAWAVEGPSVTLFEEPENGGYRRHMTVPFGEKVHLPEPFDLTLETERFPGPESWV